MPACFTEFSGIAVQSRPGGWPGRSRDKLEPSETSTGVASRSAGKLLRNHVAGQLRISGPAPSGTHSTGCRRGSGDCKQVALATASRQLPLYHDQAAQGRFAGAPLQSATFQGDEPELQPKRWTRRRRSAPGFRQGQANCRDLPAEYMQPGLPRAGSRPRSLISMTRYRARGAGRRARWQSWAWMRLLGRFARQCESDAKLIILKYAPAQKRTTHGHRAGRQGNHLRYRRVVTEERRKT